MPFIDDNYRNMTFDELKLCRKCTDEDIKSFEEARRMLPEYISRIDPDLRADEAEYASRLEACACCDGMFAGTCRYCGCFVELRAAVAARTCPHPEESRWKPPSGIG